jgi:hypothetical protein
MERSQLSLTPAHSSGSFCNRKYPLLYILELFIDAQSLRNERIGHLGNIYLAVRFDYIST